MTATGDSTRRQWSLKQPLFFVQSLLSDMVVSHSYCYLLHTVTHRAPHQGSVWILEQITFGVYWPSHTLQVHYAPGPLDDCLPPVKPCPASPNVLLNLSPHLLQCSFPSPTTLLPPLLTSSSLLYHSSPAALLLTSPVTDITIPATSSSLSFVSSQNISNTFSLLHFT